MKMWFSNDPSGDGIVFHETEAEARASAEKALDAERDCAPDDGWSESVEYICWGKVMGHVAETERRPSEVSKFDDYVDYALIDIK